MSPTFSGHSLLAGFFLPALLAAASPAPLPVRPDLVVAANGSAAFRTIQAALDSIPADNRERVIVFIKDGTYHEKVRIDPRCVTLRGESRASTRIEFPQGREEWQKQPDQLGFAVLNINGDDCVVEDLTVENTHGVPGVHAFAIYGRADRTVITDCDVFSQGNDTLSLWQGDTGRYYHARLNVRGSVDFVCPRGWCYMTDSTITQVNPGATAAIWHDGSKNRDMKFVLRGCKFDGPPDWYLARHHADAQFYLLDCTFSAAMRDRAPYRVIYPLAGADPTDASRKRNQELDKVNLWGERAYYFNCHRTGGDYAWHHDNLASAPGAPIPGQVTAAWTFAGTWDPERTAGPGMRSVTRHDGLIEVVFDENVTVKGRPRLALFDGGRADYASGSGSNTLVFNATAGGTVTRLDLHDGAILATEAGATLRSVDPTLPLPAVTPAAGH
jgi:pectinesterase